MRAFGQNPEAAAIGGNFLDKAHEKAERSLNAEVIDPNDFEGIYTREEIDTDIVINVQGDEPFVDKDSLKNLIEIFKDDPNQEIALASLMTGLSGNKDIKNPSNVKVIVDLKNFALYFSRSVIPYDRDSNLFNNYYKHIGVYAFRKSALLEFSQQEITPLEAAEKIECIRFLEYGKKLKMVYTDKINFGIDTPEDLQRAQEYIKTRDSQ